MAKKIKLELTPTQLESLQKIIEYMNYSEKTHFEEYIADGGQKRQHIFSHVERIDKLVNYPSTAS